MIKFILIIAATFIIDNCNSPLDRMTLYLEDNGKTVNLAVEDEFFIALEANPTSGFTWAIKQIDTSMIEQKGDVAFKAGSDRLGAPGIQTFSFYCLHRGTTDLSLIYHRPWDKTSAPSDTFSITLNITD